MAFQLSSDKIGEGQRIPQKYTADGADVSPPLAWVNPPDGTLSFALICDDPDAPVGTWVHWVVCNIPADARALDEAASGSGRLPAGSQEGVNDFRKTGYGGPAPPRGPVHRYVFTLYALDTSFDSGQIGQKPTKKQLVAAMEGHILASTRLIGTYSR